jgi:hypothetical protein
MGCWGRLRWTRYTGRIVRGGLRWQFVCTCGFCFQALRRECYQQPAKGFRRPIPTKRHNQKLVFLSNDTPGFGPPVPTLMPRRSLQVVSSCPDVSSDSGSYLWRKSPWGIEPALGNGPPMSVLRNWRSGPPARHSTETPRRSSGPDLPQANALGREPPLTPMPGGPAGAAGRGRCRATSGSGERRRASVTHGGPHLRWSAEGVLRKRLSRTPGFAPGIVATS